MLSRVDETTNQIQNAPLEFFREYVPDITLIPRESYSSELLLTQPIYRGGALWANMSMARNSAKASKYTYADARLETILNTKRAFFNVLRSRDLLDVQLKSVELAERYLERARLRRDLGLLANDDVLRWNLQVARNRERLIDAQNNLRISKAEFNNTIGSDFDDKYVLVDIPEEDIAVIVETMTHELSELFDSTLDEWTTEALSNSPMMMTVHATTAVTRAAYKQKYSLFQPSLNFNYTYAWQTDDDIALDGIRSWRASIVLSFPLFSSLGDYTSLKEAKADLRSSEVAEADFRRTLVLRVLSAASNVRAACQRVEASRISRTIATDNLNTVENRFENGLTDNLNLVDAQVSMTATEIEYISSLYDFLVNSAELDRVLGRENVGLR
jgi:outer membrane protein